MNDPFKKIAGASLGGLFVLFALHGGAFFKSIEAAWLFLIKLTQTAPLGVAAFFASLALATMVVVTLRRWVPPWRNEHLRGFMLDLVGIVIGLHLTLLQIGGLPGMLAGLMAGMLSPILARALMGLSQMVGRAFKASAVGEPTAQAVRQGLLSPGGPRLKLDAAPDQRQGHD